MRAVASDMPPLVSSRHGHTPIFFAAATDCIAAVQTTSAPPRRHCQRPQVVTGKSPQGSRVIVQIEQYLLYSAAQLTSPSSSAATATRLTSSMLPMSAYCAAGPS
jgi:hypothetical protein